MVIKEQRLDSFFASINVVELKGPQIWDNFFLNFFLGMHFSQAVATIQSLVGSVKGVQILYSDKVSKVYNHKDWELISPNNLLINILISIY